MVHTAANLDASLDALAKAEKRFASVLETHGRPEPRDSPPGVTTLLRTIVGQQVSVAAARSMWRKLEAPLGSPPDPNACSPPTTSCAPAACRARSRAMPAARRAGLRGELDLAKLPEDDEEAIAELTRIKGIGRWSAEIYLLFAEGRPDIWPAGDLAVQGGIGQDARPGRAPEREATRELAEAWRPHRGAAAIFTWHCYNSAGSAL